MTPRSTLAMVQTAPGRLEPRELPIPELGTDDGLLRVEACGICGSDVEQLQGLLPVPLPLVPGHEPVGIVEAVGDRAAERWGVKPGDRVAVEPVMPCGACARCRAGRYTLCTRGRRIYAYVPLAEPPGLWGAYARHLYLAPNAILHPMDATLPPERAVLFNPLGAGFRWGVELAGTRPGDAVLILGPGQRGLASVIACRELGAGVILVTGTHADAHKLALARELGADCVIDVESENVNERVLEWTHGRGADVVIEVAGSAPGPVADALGYVAPGGTIVLAGVKGLRPIPDFVSDRIVLKEIRVQGAIGVTFDAYEKAIRLIHAHHPSLDKLPTRTYPLEQAERAIRILAGEIPGEEAVHCCLLPGEE